MRRDLQRIHDIVFIRSLIKSYLDQNAFLPLIQMDGSYVPGTYVNGQSISTWPSWDLVMPNLVGQALPKDPLNNFGEACTPPANAEDYDPTTCYNSEVQNFYSQYDPGKAHIYDYHVTEDAFGNKSIYNIKFNFEIGYSADTEAETAVYPKICRFEEVICH